VRAWVATEEEAAILQAAYGCEAFSLWDPEANIGYTFNIDAMRQHAERGGEGTQRAQVPITPALISHILTASSASWSHAADLPFEVLRRPALVIQHEDETAVVVDGNHRVLRWYGHGVRWAPAFILVPQAWRRFVLPVPQEYTKAQAGY